MKVLVIGSGGREHALLTKMAESPIVSELFAAPGNPGMSTNLPQLKRKDIKATDCEKLLELALSEKIDLTVVGPEVSLEAGIVDLFESKGLSIVGPTKQASLLETSKAFAKKMMIEAGVPTAGYREFISSQKALEFIDKSGDEKMVIKCDGLAAGKGVVVCSNKSEARNAVMALMHEKMIGENVNHIIIEDFLEGPEVSVFALCDQDSFKILGTACDHKRLLDGDAGPNTGGMGAISPAPYVNAAETEWIKEKIFTPILKTMKSMNNPFKGILFAGLMKTKTGFQVLEFNVRFGDPETQVLLPLIENDLVPLFVASARGEVHKAEDIQLKNKKGIHVVLASSGYPVDVKTGMSIQVDSHFALSSDDQLFYAGVKEGNGNFVTAGGRVLGVTAYRNTFHDARAAAYEFVAHVSFQGMQFRKDIGERAE